MGSGGDASRYVVLVANQRPRADHGWFTGGNREASLPRGALAGSGVFFEDRAAR